MEGALGEEPKSGVGVWYRFQEVGGICEVFHEAVCEELFCVGDRAQWLAQETQACGDFYLCRDWSGVDD